MKQSKKTKAKKVHRISEQNNDQFTLKYNEDQNCFDLLLTNAEYDDKHVQSIVTFIYNLAKNTDDVLRIGTVLRLIEEPKKPKLIL